MDINGPDGPNDFLILPTSQPLYYDITTTAQTVGNITICFSYNDVDVFGDESLLSILHYDTSSSTWSNITTTLDTISNTVCGVTTSLSEFALAVPFQSCCIGLTGNIDDDAANNVDISDLTFLIDHLFINFPPLACPEEGNIDGDPIGTIDIGDLTFLIDHLFINFPPTAACQ